MSHPYKDFPSQMRNESVPTSIPPKPRILLVEDETLLRGHLARVLSGEYTVDTAGNGTEALVNLEAPLHPPILSANATASILQDVEIAK